jgi:hypothetical protein
LVGWFETMMMMMTHCIRTIPVWPFTWLAPREHKPLEIDEREKERRNAIKLDLESKIVSMQQRLMEMSKEIQGLTNKFNDKVNEQLRYCNTHDGEYDLVIQEDTQAIWEEKQHHLQAYKRQTGLLLQKKKQYSQIIELMHSHEVERDFLILSNELGLPNTDQVDDVNNTLTEIGTEVNMGIKTITTPSPLAQLMINSPQGSGFGNSPNGGGTGMSMLDYDTLIHNAQSKSSQYQAPLPPTHTPGTKRTIAVAQPPSLTTSTTTTTTQQQNTTTTTTSTKQPLVFQKLFKTANKTQG